MKKLALVAAVIFCSIAVFAQKIAVYETKKEINKIPRIGMAVNIQLDAKFVEKQWNKKLKEFGGKSSSVKNGYEITGANIPPVAKNPVKIFTTVDKSKDGVEVWWGIDMGTAFLEKGGQGWGAAEKILHDFALEVYREDINIQIADAEKALEKAQKDYDKEVKNGESIDSNIDKNAKEKEKLEQALKDNASQLEQLKKDKEQNKKDQESAKKEADKMKQAVDVVRKKLDNFK